MSPGLTRKKRLLAMAWFAASSMVALMVFFYPLSMASEAKFLFFGLPAISGAVAGYAFGGSILDETRTCSYGTAVLKGAGIALSAFAIFAVLFAISLPVLERGWAFDQVGSLFIGTLTFGFLTGGPIAVIAGGIAGASLYWAGSRMRA